MPICTPRVGEVELSDAGKIGHVLGLGGGEPLAGRPGVIRLLRTPAFDNPSRRARVLPGSPAHRTVHVLATDRRAKGGTATSAISARLLSRSGRQTKYCRRVVLDAIP